MIYDLLCSLNNKHKDNCNKNYSFYNNKYNKEMYKNNYTYVLCKSNNTIIAKNLFDMERTRKISSLLDILYLFRESENIYIKNISFLRKFSKVLNYIELDNTLAQRLKNVFCLDDFRKNVNSLYIKRVDNINLYLSKFVLSGGYILSKLIISDIIVFAVAKKGCDVFIVSEFVLKLLPIENYQKNGFRLNDLNFINLYIDNLDVSDIGTLAGFFEYCSKTKEIVLKNFDTKNIVSFNSMFNGCTLLRYVNVEDFDTSSAVSFTSMFRNCVSISSLDLHNWNTYNILYLNSTFENCSNLECLNISNWKTPYLIDLNSFVSGCTKLNYLDLRGIPIGYNCVNKNNWNKNCLYLKCDY